MRNYSLPIIFIIALFLSSMTMAQMVKKVDDIDLLDSNKNCFIGKSVENLLREIEPEIKMVKLVPGIPGHRTSSLTFLFIPIDDYIKFEREHLKQPPYLRLIVNKNDFEFNWNGLKWTKLLADKFKNYMVEDIIVHKLSD